MTRSIQDRASPWTPPCARQLRSGRARGAPGFSLLELLIGLAILATLGMAAFDLLSVQRREVFGSERSLLLHARALQRLAEEESRLNVIGFSVQPGQVTTKLPALEVTETVSVEPVRETTGMWLVEVHESYADPVWGISHIISVPRLVVDRDRLTRLPAALRRVP